MKKVLILYAKYGGGHFSAASAIQNYIEENYSNSIVNCVDCVSYINEFLNKTTTGAYKNLTKSAPRLWKKLYYGSQKGIIGNFSTSINKLMSKKLLKLFKQFNPDIVISAHPFSSQMAGYIKKHYNFNYLLATVMTDFAPHEQWLINNEYCDLYFISNENMKKQMINLKIPENKIYVTGIPLSKKFQNKFNKDEIYEQFNLNKNKETILFFGGGEFGLGKEKTIKILNSLTNYLDKYQIIAISGKNKKMYEKFSNLAVELNNNNLHILEYTKNIPELMSISSLVITKPGGLTSSESLASGLPIIIINPIPGQEEENAEFIENSGAGIWLKENDDINEFFKTILNNSQKLENMKNNAMKIGKLHSTEDICKIIFNY